MSAAPARLALPGPVALLAFLSGLAMPVVIDFVGLVYITEVLLMPTALVALLMARGHRAFAQKALWVLVVCGLVTLGGYVLSDLVRSTEPAQYARGWAKGIFQIVDLLLLAIIVASDRRNLWWYALGAALGGLVFQSAIGHSPIDSWKVTYAVPVNLLLLCLAPALGARFTALALLAPAAIGLVFDSRADPAIVVIVAMVLWARGARPQRALSRASFAWRFAAPLVVGGVAFAAVFIATQERYGLRREQSNLGRELTFTLGWRAIQASPLIGYGSWNDNPAISKLQEEIFEKDLGQSRAGSFAGAGFTPHSQLMQSWYEGGVLAIAFFVALLYWIARVLPELAMRRPVDALTGLLLYLLFSGVWHLVMSPFAGNHRLDNMLSAAAVLIVLGEARTRRPRPAARSTRAGSARALAWARPS